MTHLRFNASLRFRNLACITTFAGKCVLHLDVRMLPSPFHPVTSSGSPITATNDGITSAPPRQPQIIQAAGTDSKARLPNLMIILVLFVTQYGIEAAIARPEQRFGVSFPIVWSAYICSFRLLWAMCGILWDHATPQHMAMVSILHNERKCTPQNFLEAWARENLMADVVAILSTNSVSTLQAALTPSARAAPQLQSLTQPAPPRMLSSQSVCFSKVLTPEPVCIDCGGHSTCAPQTSMIL
jgi:hypothetical protein